MGRSVELGIGSVELGIVSSPGRGGNWFEMECPAEEKEDRSPESVECSGCWAGMRGRAPGFRCSPVGAADFQDITPRGMPKAGECVPSTSSPQGVASPEQALTLTAGAVIIYPHISRG